MQLFNYGAQNATLPQNLLYDINQLLSPYVRKPTHRCDVNHLANRSTSLVLVIACRPQQKSTGSPFSVFLDEFSELVDYHILKPAPILMVGDFNLLVNKPTKPEPRAFLNFLTASELQQHVAVPTHKDGNTHDLLIDRVSDLPTFTDWKVIDGITTDHFAVMCKQFLQKPPAAAKTITTRNIRGIDIDSFYSDIASAGFDSLLSCDVNHLTNRYADNCDILGQTIEKHAPMKMRTVKLRPNTSWYSSEISEEKRKR